MEIYCGLCERTTAFRTPWTPPPASKPCPFPLTGDHNPRNTNLDALPSAADSVKP